MILKKTERGYAGHFICSERCVFHRNTLLELGELKVIVSTVGRMTLRLDTNEPKVDTVGHERYYETMVFIGEKRDDCSCVQVNVSKEVSFDSPWSINKKWADHEADDMHEKIIREISKKMKNNELE